eukprot:999153-Pyramimonas_sp.AAC.1
MRQHALRCAWKPPRDRARLHTEIIKKSSISFGMNFGTRPFSSPKKASLRHAPRWPLRKNSARVPAMPEAEAKGAGPGRADPPPPESAAGLRSSRAP